MKKVHISFILVIFLVWFSLSGFQPLPQQTSSPLQISSFLLQSSITAAPDPFGKQLPINGAVSQPTSNLTLQWGASSPNVTYQYCLRLNKAACPPPKWIKVGSNTSITLHSLTPNNTYYWQVRAVDASNNSTEADNKTWWQFTTIQNPSLPGAFNKLIPPDGQTDVPVNSLALTWTTSSLSTSYEYCYDTLNNNFCDTSWKNVSGLSASASGLSYDTTYYWQVRAVNANGNVEADLGTWFDFHTQIAPPQAFTKLSPTNASPDKMPVNLTLQWSPSAGASEYYYCVDTTSHPVNDAGCGGIGWVLNTSAESNHLGLSYNTTYYWQVYAKNGQGTLQSDNGAWWSFTTIASSPSSFTKISPIDKAIDQLLPPRLYWWTPSNPLSTYQYCIDTAIDCPSGSWTDIAKNAPIPITAPLNHNTTYYWQVRASSGGGTVYANNAWWSFTTLMAPPTSSDQSFSTDENTPLSASMTAESNYGKYFELYGNSPAGSLDFHSDGSFTYTPDAYFSGTITFQFVVSDGHNSPVGPYTVTITVNPVNNPPTLSPIPDQVVENGKQVTFRDLGTDPDLPYGDHLTYSIDEALPSGAAIDPETGLFNWSVPANQGSRVFIFTVRVTDSGGLSSSQQAKITVEAHLMTYIPVIVR